MGIEIEVKFRATPENQKAIRSAFGGEFSKIEMETTYYDTPEGSLSARWYTLRRRMENEKSVCTLKVPEKGLGRGEYEVCCEDIAQAIPELERRSDTELVELTKAGLVQVCGARFTRLCQTVAMPECTVEIALDAGVLMGGDKTVPLCEVEVELKSGSREAVLAFSKVLASRFQLKQETGSKFRRALALAKGE